MISFCNTFQQFAPDNTPRHVTPQNILFFGRTSPVSYAYTHVGAEAPYAAILIVA